MDIAENREHAPEACLLLDLARRGIIQACVAPITYTTVSFLLHRYGKEQVHEMLQRLSSGVEVLPMDAVQFHKAMAYGPVRDFEDMMQYQCAASGGCEVIVTGDRKGFEGYSALPVMTAAEFLQSMMKQ